MHRDKCLKLNQLDALISQIYFWNKTLHVSDSFSVHLKEFFTVHTAMLCHTAYLYDIYQCFSIPGINYTVPREILLELIINLNVILYLSTCHTVHIIVLIIIVSNLSNDRSKVFSKSIPPHSAI